ncbi:lipoprotein-releasing ABC transporter permease subunit [Allohahella marinimesophila]|uniref:Lipoprotein-releasing ABC transporter permease subunit n=1 Tax=Allohahella marinimesophila TaxID=1054972 RepID=A0ABP7NMQ9_9GAMM
MFKPLPFFIGLRYTWAKKGNHFISFISLSSMIGLALGVLVLITVMSVMNGFDRELRERILGMVPHATIQGYDGMRDWRAIAEKIPDSPDIVAMAPYIHAQGMLTSSGSVRGMLLNGVEPALEKGVSIVQNHMKAGSIDDLESGEFNIVLGDILASYMHARIGDKVTVVLPEASVTPAGVFPRLKRFKVVGIFSVGAEIDGNLALIHIDDAAKLKRMGDRVDGIRLKVDDLFKAQQVAWRAVSALGSNYSASDWTRSHGNLFQAIRMEKTLVGLLLMMIIAVAAFNIVSTLVMVVTDKRADIAILRTMGATPGTILRIFLFQGLLIGCIGIFSGAVLGVLLATNISGLIAWVEQTLGFQFLSADVYFISYLPSQLLWNDVAVICGSALGLAFLATIYPAMKASKIAPAEALRYE